MSAFLTGYDGAKLAVTVVLVRDTDAGLEVYVQERVPEMPTFPSTTVFPGGGVDRRDQEHLDLETYWHGLSLETWSARLAMSAAATQGLIMAAGRELFEETGTLLAQHRDGSLIADASRYHQQRLALEHHQLSFSQLLTEHNLVMRTDALLPFLRWVSPADDPVQYDLFSFIAKVPAGQAPDGNTREAASTGWFSPTLILDGWREGLLQLVLPTWAHLHILSEHDTVASLLAAHSQQTLAPILGNPYHEPRFAEYFSFTPPTRFIL